MDRRVKKHIAQIAAGTDVQAAASALNTMRDANTTRDKTFEKLVITQIMATAPALDNLLESAVAKHAASKMLLFYLLLPVTGSAVGIGYEGPKTILGRAVVSSKHCKAITQDFTQDLSCSDGHARYRACMVLEALTTQPSGTIAVSRAAAEAGAIPKLIELMKNPPNSLVMPYPLMVLEYICSNSENRAKQAIEAGALEPLVDLLASPFNFTSAMTAIHGIRKLASPPKDADITRKLIRAMARVLGTPGDNGWKDNEYKVGSCQILYRIACEEPRMRSSTAAALLQEKALPGLMQVARMSDTDFTLASQVLLQCLSLDEGCDGTSTQPLAVAAVGAGLAVIIKKYLRSPGAHDRRAVDGAMMLLTMLGKHSGRASAIDRAFDDLTDGDAAVAREIMTGWDEESEADEADSCARCGATKGSGKGGSLLHCAQCKKVQYCSRDCQRADWKTKHKQRCQQKQYVDHSGAGGPQADEPWNSEWVAKARAATGGGGTSSSRA